MAFNEPAVLTEVIDEILLSIQKSCRDYFLWTRGQIHYGSVNEALLHVTAGRALFERFAPQYHATVKLEHKLRDILPGRRGRADLSVSFPDGPTVVIEFKKHFNDSSIASDLSRLREIVKVPGHIGILAGPCFIRERDQDWVELLARKLDASAADLTAHTSDVSLLPVAFQHPEGYNRSRAILLRVST